MIMVIILIGIVAAVIAIPLSQGVKGWFQATSREGISQSGRIGIERMTREIRNTARKSDNTPCISAAASTSFTFSDISGNLTNCNSITFCQSTIPPACSAGAGTYLLRGSDTLVDNVSSLNIRYYDQNNCEITVGAACLIMVPANIRRLSIEIISTQGGETLRKYNEVYLSNMKGY